MNIVYCPLPRQGTRCAHERQKQANYEPQRLEQHPQHEFSHRQSRTKVLASNTYDIKRPLPYTLEYIYTYVLLHICEVIETW